MKRRKPKIITRCVANNYAMADERIIEISDRQGAGGLISIRTVPGGLQIALYELTDCAVNVSRKER